ncbi:hypothetical protein HU200_008324 [Digitaria exilis]|uniref:Reverse transcriptase zinc-binding domain-containing protein n=1 Tax=Digitaria exilis TaxID=1010633 RepID=A0A835KTV9_9POAL|nr:hypothetical protein HU200_008324 [Digitaria exilis]
MEFISWLLVQNKIQCKTNHLLKNIVVNADCEFWNSGAESPDHLILHCPFAIKCWAAFRIEIQSDASVTRLWEPGRPQNIPAAFYSTYLLLCSWQLWKHWHDVIFGAMEPSLIRLMLCFKEKAHLSCCRLPRSDQISARASVNYSLSICRHL